nr:MAG TPA: hypothetical protein [Caudoviricetes sp.]
MRKRLPSWRKWSGERPGVSPPIPRKRPVSGALSTV